MHELRRLAYLEALGIECYESRRPLPGAAVSRPWPIVAMPRAIKPNAAVSMPVLPEIPALAPHTGAAKFVRNESMRPTRIDAAPPASIAHAHSVPRFSLVAVVAGDWLWLEELGEIPLTTEQVQLMQAMAHALQRHRGNAASAPAPTRPDVLRFDWPMHNNRQLDSGEDAARAGATAFISRRLEQSRCRGLVLLGQSCANRVLPNTIGALTVFTASSADMLLTPALKRQAWQDLLPLVRAP